MIFVLNSKNGEKSDHEKEAKNTKESRPEYRMVTVKRHEGSIA